MSDRISEIRKEANGLLEQKSDSEERVQIRVDVGSALPVYIGRTFPTGAFTAVIRSIDPADVPSNFRRPEIQGLAIRWVHEKNRAGGTFDIVMELLHVEAIDVFVVFIARLCEIVEQCESSKDAVAEALGQIELWRHFFAGAASQALSENQQTGLYGELSMFRRLADDGLQVAAAVKAWTGASKTNQDFEFSRVAIEVKSTTSIDAKEVSITNVRQLDTTGLDLLYLARLAFDARRGKEDTLITIVTNLRDLVLAEAAYLKAVFEQKLLSAGFRDEHAGVYEDRSYTLRSLEFYLVKGDFPRLEEDGLPDGVSKVKYRVNLHGCGQYVEDTGNAIEKVIKASG